MKCKYCEAELAQWGGFCPVCGKKKVDEESMERESSHDSTRYSLSDLNEENSNHRKFGVSLNELRYNPGESHFESKRRYDVDPWEEGKTDETGEGPSLAIKKARRMAAMSGCIALLAVLATVLFFGIRGGWEVENLFGWLKPRENTIHYRDAYEVDDKKMIKKADDVVATMGGVELTNAQLQIYYWNEVYGFLGNYSYYLSYLGFDYAKPLSEQTCYFDQNLTWEQYFLESAIQVWQSNVAFAEVAAQKNYVLPEEYQNDLDTMDADLQKKATEGGYASLDAMVQESFGAGVTYADYKEYMQVYYYGYAYFEELYNAIDPTEEQIKAYFEANKEALEKEGIKQDGTYTVDVRHILVMMDKIVEEMKKDESQPEAQDEDKKEDSKYTDEQWAACLAAAQKIYDEWLAGDKTEAHFGELANKYSHDKNGKVTDGGIYTFVNEGDMVEDFNTWCFEEGRKPGDTGIVKTQFGYHVMYFVGSEEVWFTKTRSAYISNESNKIVEDTLKQFTIEINYKKIVLGKVAL